jgi:hypothetical protein
MDDYFTLFPLDRVFDDPCHQYMLTGSGNLQIKPYNRVGEAIFDIYLNHIIPERIVFRRNPVYNRGIKILRLP